MAEQFVGKFKLVSSENFDEYMKKLGIGFALRAIGNSVKPTIDVKHEGDKWIIESHSTFKNVYLNFKLGEEFEETTPDGRVVKSVITLEDGKLIHKQKAIKEGDKDTVITREIKDGDMHVGMECDGVSAVRIYKREL